jgi:RNA polymerase sigma-70 factor (ECF subfamily)
LAWQVWYDASFAELLAYVTWRCGGRRDQANDIVQETWLTAVRQIRTFDPAQGSFAGWLRGIAHNLLRNYVRQSKRADQSLEPLVIDRASEPCDEAQQQVEQSDRITEALAALPPRYEAVLKAKYLDQLPVKQIALQWNETPSAIESLLTRARDAFRRLYRDPGYEVTPEADADGPTYAIDRLR